LLVRLIPRHWNVKAGIETRLGLKGRIENSAGTKTTGKTIKTEKAN